MSVISHYEELFDPAFFKLWNESQKRVKGIQSVESLEKLQRKSFTKLEKSLRFYLWLAIFKCKASGTVVDFENDVLYMRGTVEDFEKEVSQNKYFARFLTVIPESQSETLMFEVDESYSRLISLWDSLFQNYKDMDNIQFQKAQKIIKMAETRHKLAQDRYIGKSIERHQVQAAELDEQRLRPKNKELSQSQKSLLGIKSKEDEKSQITED